MSSIYYLWDAIKKYCNSFPEPRIIEQNYLCDVVSYLYSFPMKRRSGSCFKCHGRQMHRDWLFLDLREAR